MSCRSYHRTINMLQDCSSIIKRGEKVCLFVCPAMHSTVLDVASWNFVGGRGQQQQNTTTTAAAATTTATKTKTLIIKRLFKRLQSAVQKQNKIYKQQKGKKVTLTNIRNFEQISIDMSLESIYKEDDAYQCEVYSTIAEQHWKGFVPSALLWSGTGGSGHDRNWAKAGSVNHQTIIHILGQTSINASFQIMDFSWFCYVLLCNHEYFHCLNHRQTKDYKTRRNKTERDP